MVINISIERVDMVINNNGNFAVICRKTAAVNPWKTIQSYSGRYQEKHKQI